MLKEASQLRAELLQDAKKNKPLLITPKVGIGPIKFGLTKKDVEEVLGKPYRVTGQAHEYQHLGFAVIFDKQDKVGAILGGAWCEISDILLDVFKGVTAKGIKLRSTKQQVISAYGKPSKTNIIGANNMDFEVLKYDSLRTDFALRKGKIVHITLKRPK
jgi:hypothetical protein